MIPRAAKFAIEYPGEQEHADGFRRVSTMLLLAVIVYGIWYDQLAPANRTIVLLGVLVVAVAAGAVPASDLRDDIRTYHERYR